MTCTGRTNKNSAISLVNQIGSGNMSEQRSVSLSRRAFIAGSATVALVPRSARANSPGFREYKLIAAPALAAIVGTSRSQTEVWAYQGIVPAPKFD